MPSIHIINERGVIRITICGASLGKLNRFVVDYRKSEPIRVSVAADGSDKEWGKPGILH